MVQQTLLICKQMLDIKYIIRVCFCQCQASGADWFCVFFSRGFKYAIGKEEY